MVQKPKAHHGLGLEFWILFLFTLCTLHVITLFSVIRWSHSFSQLAPCFSQAKDLLLGWQTKLPPYGNLQDSCHLGLLGRWLKCHSFSQTFETGKLVFYYCLYCCATFTIVIKKALMFLFWPVWRALFDRKVEGYKFKNKHWRTDIGLDLCRTLLYLHKLLTLKPLQICSRPEGPSKTSCYMVWTAARERKQNQVGGGLLVQATCISPPPPPIRQGAIGMLSSLATPVSIPTPPIWHEFLRAFGSQNSFADDLNSWQGKTAKSCFPNTVVLVKC